ncbi:MAG TPA: sn-glycerol-3-phosphate ABC transporter ATP-binding protein UgpC [Phycisphaerae bacterium]|nr:sn-glycerol-3-phosphate ABC transporter ATP-binding protein UgpC [Phycisphaerae bacterium]
MATVALEHVHKVYGSDSGQVDAVRDVTLDIADREFIVLVGPSGCGKSTTLRMVAGLEDVSSGTIRIGGRVVNNVAPKDRDIAMVFQNYALYPHMTVYKNMAFGLRMRKVAKPEIRRRVGEAAGLLGIEGLLERKPKQLSGGERQRVAVGRAIVREPQAFLFDEPLSNLDAKLRVQMRAELKKLHRRLRTTVIYVTHDQEEAMTLGDRIVVMKSGVVHQCDAPLEVYDRPRDRFVASFVGTPPMNFFEGLVRVGDGDVLFETSCGQVRLPQHLGERLADRRGEAFVLGVRPEAFSFPEGGGSSGTSPEGGDHLRMRVAVVEPLGSEKDVHLQTADGGGAVARVPSHVAVVEGNDVDVFLDSSRVHVFAPGEAGLNIGLNGYGARSSVN